MIWFTSDWHGGHANILKYAERPFADLDVMHRELTLRYRMCIDPKDDVYFLGDLWLGKDDAVLRALYEPLPGRKFFVRGNHDWSRATRVLRTFMTEVPNGHELTYEPEEGRSATFVLRHKPTGLAPFQAGAGMWLLHGHTHRQWGEARTGPRSLDVGVDSHAYAPLNAPEVLDELRRPWDSRLALGDIQDRHASRR